MSVAVFIELHLLCDVCRLRFFNQLEDELQSHQQEEQWLRDKGQQLAQRDAELGGEVLREISLLQTTWEDTKKLITERWATRNDLLYFFCYILLVFATQSISQSCPNNIMDLDRKQTVAFYV